MTQRWGERLRALSSAESKDAATWPAQLELSAEELPDAPYTVRLGYTAAKQAIELDLAQRDRAILVGGTSGYGKTNCLRSLVLQLVCRQPAASLQLAVVDLKEVDFTGPLARLPHYFRPVAYQLETAATLIEQVEGGTAPPSGALASGGGLGLATI